MAGKSNVLENDILAFLLNGTALPAISGAVGYPAGGGNFYVALHTADPFAANEDAGATTSEANYTGYARQPVARSSGGFTVSASGGVTSAKNTAAINFPACTAGSNTITHFSVVNTASGAGAILYSGALSASLAVSSGITPQFAAQALVITED